MHLNFPASLGVLFGILAGLFWSRSQKIFGPLADLPPPPYIWDPHSATPLMERPLPQNFWTIANLLVTLHSDFLTIQKTHSWINEQHLSSICWTLDTCVILHHMCCISFLCVCADSRLSCSHMTVKSSNHDVQLQFCLLDISAALWNWQYWVCFDSMFLHCCLWFF